MQVKVTFRNTDSNEKVKDRAYEKAAKIKKFIKSPIQVSFVFSKNNLNHTAELLVLGEGHNYSAHVEKADYFAAIDDCVDKMLVQLKKQKDKIKNKKGGIKTSEVAQISDEE